MFIKAEGLEINKIFLSSGWHEVDEIIKSKISVLGASEFQCEDCLHLCRTRQNIRENLINFAFFQEKVKKIGIGGKN